MPSKHPMGRVIGSLLVAVGLAPGCVGAIDGEAVDEPGGADSPGVTAPGSTGASKPAGASTGTGAGVPIGVDVPAPSGGGTPTPAKTYKSLQPAPATMYRLTHEQYLNSVADVFGTSVKPLAPLEEDEDTETFLSIGAAKVGTAALGVEKYQQAALSIADQVMRDRAKYPWLATCAPDRADDPCVARAIETVGLRLYRRPLTTEEVQRYVRLVGADGIGKDKVDSGLRYALATLLQSPNFLYVPAVGEDDPASGFRRFTGYELAARLAIMVWNSTPDPELLEAARTGKLATKQGIDTELRRMLTRPRARSVAGRFLAEFWKVSRLAPESKNTKLFPVWTSTLLASYRRELELVVEDLVFGRDADVRELFDGRQTMIDGNLAKLYGMGTGSTTFTRAALPEVRTGLLTSGAVIAANSKSNYTSPTVRGVFLLERILCKEVPAPPPNVMDQLPETPQGQAPKSLREKLEMHRTEPACAACHSLFDPIGLSFENFDAIGAYRTSDAGRTIDPTGELEGKSYRGLREVATFLRADPRPPQCVAKHLYSFAVGHDVTAGEEGVVEALGDAFVAGGHKLQALLREVATSGGFRYFAVDK